MQNDKQFNKIIISNIRVFGSLRVMIVSALFVALSIIFGKYLAINPNEFVRISFENLPILMGGIFFGPLVGACIGATADLLGCLMVGYTINPIITLGAVSIGFISGLISSCFKRKNSVLCLGLSVFIAHIIGSMIIKSLGLHFWYNVPFSLLVFRIPNYLIISFVEFLIIILLLKNKAFTAQIEKIKPKKRNIQ